MTAAERDEQRKMIKYNHLVANLLIFHTAVGMTRALESMAADGFADAISPEALTTLSPYQTEHINRFGDYVLDLSTARAAALRSSAAAAALTPGHDGACVKFWRGSSPWSFLNQASPLPLGAPASCASVVSSMACACRRRPWRSSVAALAAAG